MPAHKVNYLVLYTGSSQVYAAGKKEIALESPPPEGVELTEKRIFFVTYNPDKETLTMHALPQDDILNAVLKYPKKKDKMADEQEAETEPPDT